MRCVALLAIALVAGCGGRGVDHERDGDRAWADDRAGDALVAWRQAPQAPRLLAKRAEAALVTGQLVLAAQLWVELAAAAPERTGEAASGLARTASVAERQNDGLALRQAILALREIAPAWPVGRLALGLRLDEDLAAADVAALVPVVLATSPGPNGSAALLSRLADAERLLGRCDIAVPVFELVARRSDAAMAAETVVRLASCELALGLEAMARDDAAAAREWLERAAGRGPDSAPGRRALVALGDLDLADGDPFAAMLTWQSVVATSVAPDSITALAQARLRSVPMPPEVTESVERP